MIDTPTERKCTRTRAAVVVSILDADTARHIRAPMTVGVEASCIHQNTYRLCRLTLNEYVKALLAGGNERGSLSAADPAPALRVLVHDRKHAHFSYFSPVSKAVDMWGTC